MLIIITIASILGLTALVRLGEKVLPFKVCPICAGVSLTWAWLLAAHFLGYRIDLMVPALLMGGTVVGLAYQLAPLEARPLTGFEKKFTRPSLLWKTLFIPSGFVAAYGILLQLWTVALLAIAFLFLISLLFLSSGGRAGSREAAAGDIENKMKDCC
ncbi:MAG: hypothetical protein Q7S05_01430 [bacterium]|nr:hypothetical protein [bacterium]